MSDKKAYEKESIRRGKNIERDAMWKGKVKPAILKKVGAAMIDRQAKGYAAVKKEAAKRKKKK